MRTNMHKPIFMMKPTRGSRNNQVQTDNEDAQQKKRKSNQTFAHEQIITLANGQENESKTTYAERLLGGP